MGTGKGLREGAQLIEVEVKKRASEVAGQSVAHVGDPCIFHKPDDFSATGAEVLDMPCMVLASIEQQKNTRYTT